MIREALRLHRLFKNGILADSPDFIQEKQPDSRYQLKLKQRPAKALRVSSPTPTPIKRRVLLWEIDSEPGGIDTGLGQANAIYLGLGVPSDFEYNWTGNLSDYGLIIWPIAENDPVWWSQVDGGGWQGRIHLTTEYDIFVTSRDYVNSKTALHGMINAADASSPPGGANEDATPGDDPLAQGLSRLVHADTSSVSGGITVFTNTTLGLPMMQHNQPGRIDWVLAGDSNHITDLVPGNAIANAGFFENLINVPLA
jgi:hypothetical protein